MQYLKTLICLLLTTFFLNFSAMAETFSDSPEFKDFMDKFSRIKNTGEIYPGYDAFRQPIILLYSYDNQDEFILINKGEIVFKQTAEKQKNLDLFAYYYPKAKHTGLSFTLPEQLNNYLEKNNIERAFIFKFNYNPKIISKLTDNREKFFDSDNILRIVFILHEGFHLQITLPKWIEKKAGFWPKWDIQPDRKKLSGECYYGSDEIKKLYQQELNAIVKLFGLLYTDSNSSKMEIEQAAREFITTREKRYGLTSGKNLSKVKEYPMNCEESETIMEMEEGIPDFIAKFLTVETKLVNPAQVIALKENNVVDPFYSFGALQLMVLYRLDKAVSENVFKTMIGSENYHGGIFYQFKDRVSN